MGRRKEVKLAAMTPEPKRDVKQEEQHLRNAKSRVEKAKNDKRKK